MGTPSSTLAGSAAVRDALCELAARYGPGLLRDAQRCDAMLRDLCPGRKREIFLAVAALREGVAGDLYDHRETMPAGMLTAQGTRRLADNLGLAEDAARSAVELWLPAVEAMGSWTEPPSSPSWSPSATTALATGPGLDREWLLCCGGALALSAAALGFIGRAALWHGWTELGQWGLDTGVFSAGLGLCWFGLASIATRMRRIRVPRHAPERLALGLTFDVLTLLGLPVVPPVAVALWAGEWTGHLHVYGAAHDLVFHLGRMLQTVILAVFLFFWIQTAVGIQGTIARSAVRQR